ncbi:type III restriction enzyme, res subunit [Kordia sp. SMS9]|uniref:TOTE conflict system archaeo-eukaryotic primase domain-containing protein n=1 Tax=Kordia sp. SMS9 TaxID=2282170 RepID=UPI000E0DAB52|nr:DEAD/DEAH box helicase [Kordia sp. SMS9]AXG71978.1 type III restriction enzyme, res subunit [Kordia sp. SMS9]
MESNDGNTDLLNLFRSLFKGREDVFALRWEKGNKSGYTPAYSYDPYMYRLHKQRGGTFKDYKDKTYVRLDNLNLSKHLKGEKYIGIYPLLKNNTSWFIVADFDKGGWQEQSRKAIEVCNKNNIPAYLERSRSGNGGHVWIFFEEPYAAIKSRKIILKLFEQAGIFSVFDRNTSFDRLFPNQDYLSGKGLGNLIALPFQGQALQNGNSCFISINTFTPYEDQWGFLKTIKKISTVSLDSIFKKTFKKKDNKSDFNVSVTNFGKLEFALKNSIVINRNGLAPAVINFLKENLNFFNADYAIKKKTGRSTWKTDRYFKLIDETENAIEIPRGFVGNLIRFCKQQGVEYEFIDQRKRLKNVEFLSSIQLLKHQHPPLEIALKKDFGIIVAPPGSGKTIIGLKIIEHKKQPALIITHRKQIAEQWISRIETFFGIPKREIGKIGQGKIKIGKHITVALIQTLGKKLTDEDNLLTSAFGTIIIDECHHIPAKSFREVVHKLSPYYQYGLTATPFRKNNDEKLLFVYLGNIISEIKPQDIDNYKKARIVIRDTHLNIPFNSKTDRFETLSKILIHDSERNKLILNDVRHELNNGRKVVLITERKEHVLVLCQYLKSQYETIPISGEDSSALRTLKWNSIEKGDFQAIITTGQFFGEGVDIQSISCLFLVYPFAFKGKLIQYIGRVQRSELTPVIYDYRDKHIPYLNKLFLKRNSYYRNLDRQATLFDDFKESLESKMNLNNDIDKFIKVAINDLDFHYGMVCFSYKLSNETLLQLEIENEEMQPEFEVLKPYFSKILSSKSITVHIQIGLENGLIVSQIATSEDINRINKEIIDSIKFQFVEQQFSKSKKYKSDDIVEKTSKSIDSLFGSEENLLKSLLKNSKFVHHKQLFYLSRYHQYKKLKIRFVLYPFSFVFLLEGEHKYHIVLETLDTKEATYVWHLPKNNFHFKKQLESINKKLNWIRNNGRQSFLETKNDNFSKVIHDYSEDKKGFYKWKNALEERLI